MSTPRIEDILAEALRWPAEERAARLDEACADDARLRAEVESLLEAHDEVGEFLSDPDVAAAPESAGAVVGRYRLLQRIGEGGFGDVFMAEQRAPVRRRVALKVIKLGMDTRQVIARFEAERQALAMMDHPGIARVLDAGATDSGRPYFVMELVVGDPITRYCDRESLTIRERLELFGQVCHAVQHAHQKGIIHRDLKPSNILVCEIDGTPTPKIIDFGIAKATAGRLTDMTLFTEFRQFVGTPQYTSPEQAASGGMDIDTRSDIYSLGVLLYELLTGTTPFDPRALRSAGLAELQRIITEDEPPRPSTRAQTMMSRDSTGTPAGTSGDQIAAQRRVDPERLGPQIRGDLDWIVMRCLEKDRSRRYETASTLAADIERHLRGEPVLAAPPSRAYRTRKFVARNRGPVAAGLAIALTLVLGIIGAGVGLARAQRQAANLERVVQFEQSQITELDPHEVGRGLRASILAHKRRELEVADEPEGEIERRLRELELALEDVNFTDVAQDSLYESIVSPGLEGIEARFGDLPLVRARLYDSLGQALGDFGLTDLARDPRGRTYDILRRVRGQDHLETMLAFRKTGWDVNPSEFAMAEDRQRRVATTFRRKYGPNDERTIGAINSLGVTLRLQGNYEEAMACFRDAFDRGREVLGVESFITISAMSHVGLVLTESDPVEAERLLREALRLREGLGDYIYSVALDCGRLSRLLQRQGQLDEAIELSRRELAIFRRIRGNDDRRSLQAMVTLGCALRAKGERDDDPSLLENAEEIHAEVIRRSIADDRSIVRYYIEHAASLIARGGLEDLRFAEERLEEAMRRTERLYPDDTILRSMYEFGVAMTSAELHDAWKVLEPNAGHAEKAQEWRARAHARQARVPGLASRHSLDPLY